VTKYQKRISGPMLDRKIPHGFSGIEVPRVDYEKLSSDRVGESSASIRERVQAARERQRVRFEGTDIVCTRICAWQKLENFASWMKRGIVSCARP
jgi:magnesium chelatase family protein